MESSLLGGTLSIAASLFIAFLLVAEFRSYMRFDTESIMVVDRSPHGELLRINFNVSFPALSCEYATLDVSDALGSKKLNLTKTVRKAPIDSESLVKVGYGVEDFQRPEPKYDEFPEDVDPYGEMDFLVPLDEASWDAHMKHYDVVIVNFFAPWCHWCQQLAPTWEAVTQVVHQKYPEADGRVRYVCLVVVVVAAFGCHTLAIPRPQVVTPPSLACLRMAKVDCVANADLCQKHQITAFPSIRIFIDGTDDVVDTVGRHNHLAYYGDRTTEALTLLADQAAEAHGKKPHMHGIQNANAINQKGSGCNFSGMLLVKKVPGTLHFSARAPGHTIDYLSMNMSHHVHHLYFGNKPTKRNRMLLESKFPRYFESDWLDKMAGQAFTSENPGATYEHYLQTVLTTVEPTTSKKLRASRSFNVYVWSVRARV